jgi:hypothetical protein
LAKSSELFDIPAHWGLKPPEADPPTPDRLILNILGEVIFLFMDIPFVNLVQKFERRIAHNLSLISGGCCIRN